ncbi:phage antirepressor KilAC domain-containing protein, partial [Melissococcus plutonius]|uniref:phage antirepressor n=1 Tax=Melissococcus plutonius TaxID=33970 RepID=UPI003EE6486B
MNIQKFANGLFELEVKTGKNEALFNAETVAKSLGLTTIAKSGNVVVRWNRVNNYLGKNSPIVAKGDFIPEPMVYKLAFKANNKNAEKFQDWLATEVLPSIRKNGMYMTDAKAYDVVTNPNSLADLLQQASDQLKQKDLVIQELKPKAIFADSVSASHTSILVGELAKLLKQNGLDMGQNKLFAWLRDKGYLIKRKGTDYNMPTQRAMEQG